MAVVAAILSILVATYSVAQNAPRIDSLGPDHGPISGSTAVTIRGAGFAGATVRLGRAIVRPLEQTDDAIALLMPPRENGYAVLSVANASGIAYAEFLYLPPPLASLRAGEITTIAGVGLHVRDYGDARQASISPEGIMYGPDGALYIAEPGPNKISRVTEAGAIERVAGNGVANASQATGDGGPALDAQISFPLSVALDGEGNVYIPDHNYRIRKVDATTGIISTVVGTGVSGFSGDGGPAIAARIGVPTFAAADDRDLFFIDFDAMRVRRFDFANGAIDTFAGNGLRGFSGDGGPATAASFDVGNSDFGALALDAAGNLYLGDAGNQRIRRIDRVTGIITTVLGPSLPGGGSLGEIRALALHPDGTIFFAGSRLGRATTSGEVLRTWSSTGRSLEDDTPIENAYMRQSSASPWTVREISYSATRLDESSGSISKRKRCRRSRESHPD